MAPADVVLLMGYTALSHLPTILALSLFVAIVVTLGRMYRDSEMAIWFSSGVAMTRFIAPVLRVSWPVLLVVAILVLVVWPWGNRSSNELRERYEQRSDLSRVTPGVFQTSRDGRRVFFIERRSDEATERARRVRAAPTASARRRDLGAQCVTSRASAPIASWCSTAGSAISSTASRANARWPASRAITCWWASSRCKARSTRSPKTLRTVDLVRDPTARNQGELIWRLGLLLGAVNLVLLAIGLAASNPRRATNWNLVFALLGFVVYYNLINLSQAWVAGGRFGLGRRCSLLHGGVLVLALSLMWWRDHGAVRHFWRRARRAGSRMKTVRRLLYRDIVWSVVFVAVAFLSLFYFIDFVDELDNIGRNGYTVLHAAIAAALELPGHFYELSPICVLIGTIYSMARLAQSSEYTILRTGGLGPVRALRLLALLGLFFGGVTFVVGDYVSPLSEREAVLLKASFRGGLHARPRRGLAEGAAHTRRRRARDLDQRGTHRGQRRARRHSHLRVRRRRAPAHRASRPAPAASARFGVAARSRASAPTGPRPSRRPRAPRSPCSAARRLRWPSTLIGVGGRPRRCCR